MLREKPRPKRERAARGWSKFHNDKLVLPKCCYGDQIKKVKWVRYIQHTWRRRSKYTKFYLENIKEEDQLQDLGADVRLILKQTEHLGRMVNKPPSYLGGPGFKPGPGNRLFR
jgi:hypothetical protein